MTQQRQPQQLSAAGPEMNLYATRVDLPERNRVEVAQTLNQALADATDLQSQAKFAHWNVKGHDFYQLHVLFDEIAETLSGHVDVLAERATALGAQAMGTTRIAASTSRIPEPPVNEASEAEHLEWVTDHVGRHANNLRADIERAAELGDEDTADLFTEISREVDKQLYFLESHLQSSVQTQVPATGARGSVTRQGAPGERSVAQQAGGWQSSFAHGGAPAHEAASRQTRQSSFGQYPPGQTGQRPPGQTGQHPPGQTGQYPPQQASQHPSGQQPSQRQQHPSQQQFQR